MYNSKIQSLLRQNPKVIIAVVFAIVAIIAVGIIVLISNSPENMDQTRTNDTTNFVEEIQLPRSVNFDANPIHDEVLTEDFVRNQPIEIESIVELYKVADLPNNIDVYQFPTNPADTDLRDYLIANARGTTLLTSGESAQNMVLYRDQVVDEWLFPRTSASELSVIEYQDQTLWIYISNDRVHISEPNFENSVEFRVGENTDPLLQSLHVQQVGSEFHILAQSYVPMDAGLFNAGEVYYAKMSFDDYRETSFQELFLTDITLEYANIEFFDSVINLIPTFGGDEDHMDEHGEGDEPDHFDIIDPTVQVFPLNAEQYMIELNSYNNIYWIADFRDQPKLYRISNFITNDNYLRVTDCQEEGCMMYNFTDQTVAEITIEDTNVTVDVSDFSLEPIGSEPNGGYSFERLVRISIATNENLDRFISRRGSAITLSVLDYNYEIVIDDSN